MSTRCLPLNKSGARCSAEGSPSTSLTVWILLPKTARDRLSLGKLRNKAPPKHPRGWHPFVSVVQFRRTEPNNPEAVADDIYCISVRLLVIKPSENIWCHSPDCVAAAALGRTEYAAKAAFSFLVRKPCTNLSMVILGHIKLTK